MTKEEYEDFALRYKGCGACFPMYHTLSRFEKMWFTAIQKDVADLEKVNAELKRDFKICEKNADTYYDRLTKAKELLKEFVQHYKAKTIYVENMQDLLEQSEQFLKEVEK